MKRLALNLIAVLLAGLFMDAAAIAQTGKVELLWLGQSAFRITTPTGKVLMIDPYLTNNPTTPLEYKNLDAIGKLDLILVSHAHYDHFEDAVPLAKKNDVPMYGPAGLNQVLLTLGVLPPRLVPRFTRAARSTRSLGSR